MTGLCTHRDKSTRVFLSGDFEFLCRAHGISGASGKLHMCIRIHMHIGIQLVGRHPCLWCQVRRDELAIPPEERQSTPQLRSLQTLQHNYLGFTTLSGGDLRKAKQHCNVIGKSFFLIPLDQVIIQSICFCANLNEAFSLIDMSPRPAHKPRYILSPLHPLGSGLQPAGCQSC